MNHAPRTLFVWRGAGCVDPFFHAAVTHAALLAKYEGLGRVVNVLQGAWSTCCKVCGQCVARCVVNVLQGAWSTCCKVRPHLGQCWAYTACMMANVVHVLLTSWHCLVFCQDCGVLDTLCNAWIRCDLTGQSCYGSYVGAQVRNRRNCWTL